MTSGCHLKSTQTESGGEMPFKPRARRSTLGFRGSFKKKILRYNLLAASKQFAKKDCHLNLCFCKNCSLFTIKYKQQSSIPVCTQ